MHLLIFMHWKLDHAAPDQWSHVNHLTVEACVIGSETLLRKRPPAQSCGSRDYQSREQCTHAAAAAPSAHLGHGCTIQDRQIKSATITPKETQTIN
jgi:hypothetical protein